ncbi:hypothetical protein BDW02DRAFT_383224 [Decorospora gaudefroyi]|uniref:Uncharacterized protein n=1 Tax=Decorospora gaudefroyi TaxID=184978 RepID=A0A6A5KBR6_9PLEO|nr:hypothetical protein BDW02DRAFT_383224 [Decorospora gaudefroyi]
MTQGHQNSWRASHQNDQANPQLKNLQADDQIAPTGVSSSVHDLQRWARMTASMPQHAPQRLRLRIHDDATRLRIQKRYGDGARKDEDDAFPPLLQARTQSNARKRPHSPSPDRTAVGAGPVSYVQAIKRRRSPSRERSPGSMTSAYAATRRSLRTDARSRDGEEDEDAYAQSSEWSFPSSQGEKGGDEMEK